MAADATHVLAGRAALDLFLRSGGELRVRRELTIAAVAANPWSAYGWHFEPDKFIAALRQVIDLPVVNVKEDCRHGTDPGTAGERGASVGAGAPEPHVSLRQARPPAIRRWYGPGDEAALEEELDNVALAMELWAAGGTRPQPVDSCGCGPPG